jgi:hypothetical protein
MRRPRPAAPLFHRVQRLRLSHFGAQELPPVPNMRPPERGVRVWLRIARDLRRMKRDYDARAAAYRRAA